MTDCFKFLNDNSGAMMVIITFAYVVATIFIWRANQKSAIAALKQVEEARAEFEEEHRALVSVDLVIVLSSFVALKIQNNGKMPAKKVNVSINEEFLCNLNNKNESCGKKLENLSKSFFSLGIGQSRYAFVCGTGEVVDVSKKMLIIELTYQDSKKRYRENLNIDISQHLWEIVYESPLEDIRKEIKGINGSIKSIKDDINQAVQMQKSNMNEKGIGKNDRTN